MNKTQTLEEFEKDTMAVDGYYAVWHSNMFYDSNQGGMVYGFTGDIVHYDVNNGWSSFPKKLNDVSDNRICVLLIEETPLQ